MRSPRLLIVMVAIGVVASACSSSNNDAATTSGDCSSVPFTGEVTSAGDDTDAEFSLTDGDIVLAQAFPLTEGSQYTVYFADYDLGDQEIGANEAIEADDSQVVITMQARNPDGGPIEPGTAYDETFVIMDSGGGAIASPTDPEGIVTFSTVTDDRICFEVVFEDSGLGQVLNATVSAEIVR